MKITDYEAKRLELDAKMQELNNQESEKKWSWVLPTKLNVSEYKARYVL